MREKKGKIKRKLQELKEIGWKEPGGVELERGERFLANGLKNIGEEIQNLQRYIASGENAVDARLNNPDYFEHGVATLRAIRKTDEIREKFNSLIKEAEELSQKPF